MRCVACALVTALGLAAPSPSFEDRHQKDAASNPAGLHFVLRTTTGATRFHPGERIPITLDFSSDYPDKYKLDAATYDRGGRLWSEDFTLDRDDAVDPLADYFGSGVIGGMMGGIRGMPVLGPNPVGIDLELNDWFRFERPGRYRMFLKSQRLTREKYPSEGEGVVQFAAVSNILEIEILPRDAAWEAQKLAELRGVLETKKDSNAEHELNRARRELRFLGTREALALMLERARHKSDELDTFTLVGSPHRAFAISELDRFIEDPNVEIDHWCLRLRAFFTFVAQFPHSLVPTRPAELRQTDWKKLQPEAERRRKEFDAILARLAVRLTPVMERKSPEVREACRQAVASIAPELVPPAGSEMTRSEPISRFGTFSQERQFELLSGKWPLVRGPEMLPVLRRAVNEAPLTAPEMYGLGGAGLLVPERALQRLEELAPGEATRILLDDLARPDPRFIAIALDVLPAQDVPAVDEVLASKLRTETFGAVRVAAKFATRKLMQPMREAFESRKQMACAFEEPFVAYFVRVDPVYGKKVLADAMASREKRGCFHSLISRVSRVVWNEVVEQQALGALDDPDGEAAADAARALSSHGGVAMEEQFWPRLEQWSRRWRGKERELDPHPITSTDPNRGERERGRALFDAIAGARAWIVDEQRAQRLSALCLDKWCRDQVPAPDRGPVRINASDGGAIYGKVFTLAQYRLESLTEVRFKMAQYPAGTAFQWCGVEDGRDQMTQFASERGQRVEDCSTSTSPSSR
jgi:hypothetical protein